VLLVSTLYSLLDIVRDASSERADFPAQVLGSVQVGPLFASELNRGFTPDIICPSQKKSGLVKRNDAHVTEQRQLHLSDRVRDFARDT
jgi:hypothetical protein